MPLGSGEIQKKNRLEVLHSVWNKITAFKTRKGVWRVVDKTEEARDYAESHGYEGIYITLKSHDEIHEIILRSRHVLRS